MYNSIMILLPHSKIIKTFSNNSKNLGTGRKLTRKALQSLKMCEIGKKIAKHWKILLIKVELSRIQDQVSQLIVFFADEPFKTDLVLVVAPLMKQPTLLQDWHRCFLWKMILLSIHLSNENSLWYSWDCFHSYVWQPTFVIR